MDIKERIKKKDVTVCVVGLGYVGLPLALAFAKNGFRVIGYDVDPKKVDELKSGGYKGYDESVPVDYNGNGINFTSDPSTIKDADFVHVCVPTLLKNCSEPDMRQIENASNTIGENLKQGAFVINESSVYPGATEEIMKPALEKASGMTCGKGFKLGFSPERVNPGDKEHDLGNVVKVVSGIDDETSDAMEELYKNIVDAGVFKAKNIKTAEMSKLSENIQRDLNIAMINELSIICKKIGIDVKNVIEAAETKWNFNKYHPGLVGGYCVPVNPIYLLHKSRELGYEPKVISAGRKLNDSMPGYVVDIIAKKLESIKESKILVMGLSFKKNVSDARESPSKILVKLLQEKGSEVLCYDPLLKKDDVVREFSIEPVDDIRNLSGIDCIVMAVGHDKFKEIKVEEIKAITKEKPFIFDIQAFFNPEEMKKLGFEYMRL